MTITLDGIELDNAQASSNEQSSDLQVIPVPGELAEDAVMYGFTSTERIHVEGEVSGQYLDRETSFGPGPRVALAEFLMALQGRCTGSQGSGYQVVDNERGINRQIVLDTFTWTIDEGAPYSASWVAGGFVGEGVMGARDLDTAAGTPANKDTIDGTDLGYIVQKTAQKESGMKPNPIPLEETQSTILIPDGGPTLSVTISGRYDGTQTELESFHNTMTDLVSPDLNSSGVVYDESTTGKSYSGGVKSYKDTFSAGDKHLDYTLEFIQGDMF